MANDKFIEEIAGKLREYSSEVNTQLWQGISTQIGPSAASGAIGGLGLAKIAGIVGIAVVTGLATYFVVTSSHEENITNTTETADSSALPKEETKEFAAPTTEIEAISDTKEIKNSKVENNTKKVSAKTNQSTVVIQSTPKEEATITTPLAPEQILSNKKPIEQTVVKSIEQKVVTVPAKTEEKIEAPKKVEQQKPLTPIITAEFLNLPNTFTPNNDGVNDEFFVETSGMKSYQLVVLDSKNNVVWTTNDPNAKWDGRNLGGEKSPNGSYLYFITAEDESGNPVQEHKRLEIQ